MRTPRTERWLYGRLPGSRSGWSDLPNKSVREAVVVNCDIPNLQLFKVSYRCAALASAPLVVLALPQPATMLLSVSKMLGEGMAMAEKMLEKVAAGELSLAELEEKVRQASSSELGRIENANDT